MVSEFAPTMSRTVITSALHVFPILVRIAGGSAASMSDDVFGDAQHAVSSALGGELSQDSAGRSLIPRTMQLDQPSRSTNSEQDDDLGLLVKRDNIDDERANLRELGGDEKEAIDGEALTPINRVRFGLDQTHIHVKRPRIDITGMDTQPTKKLAEGWGWRDRSRTIKPIYPYPNEIQMQDILKHLKKFFSQFRLQPLEVVPSQVITVTSGPFTLRMVWANTDEILFPTGAKELDDEFDYNPLDYPVERRYAYYKWSRVVNAPYRKGSLLRTIEMIAMATCLNLQTGIEERCADGMVCLNKSRGLQASP